MARRPRGARAARRPFVPNQDDDEWRVRRARRLAAVMLYYEEYMTAVRGPLHVAGPPDHDDRTLSKRAWEGAFWKWKHALRSMGVVEWDA